MQQDTKAQWEKLSLDLELLSTEDPNSILPIIAGIQNLIQPEEDAKATLRKINFMAYELTAKCEGLGESERFALLNDYFFVQKEFYINSNYGTQVSNLMINQVIDSTSGDDIAISFLYLHLANNLDLPIYLVNTSSHHILKWVRSGKNEYIDLSQSGKLLGEKSLCLVIENHCKIDSESCLDILPTKKMVFKYVSKLLNCFKLMSYKFQQLICLNILVKIEAANLKCLSERALLHKELGMDKEALRDLKRYFSFIDKSQATPELLMAFHELNPQVVNAIPNSDLLH